MRRCQLNTAASDGLAVDRKVLLTAVGFRPDMVLPLADVLSPDEVVMIAGQHPDVTKAEATLAKAFKAKATATTTHRVKDWDIQAWSQTISDCLDQLKEDQVTVNLTAGHGLATAMLAIHAAQRALPVACYDWETWANTGRHPDQLDKYVHFHSPAALLHLKETVPIDRRILQLLLEGPQSVGSIAEKLTVPQSSVSTSLGRLVDTGFLDRNPAGRNRLYQLRKGLGEFVASALG
jgi:hypothetical protein